MDHQGINDLLPLAALDWLEPAEARALEEHLRAGCGECEAELRELREVAAALALSLEPEGSADRIWERLDARLCDAPADPLHPVARETAAARRPARRRVARWRAVAAVMAAGIVGVALYAGQLTDRLRRANDDHRQQLAAMNARVSTLRAELIEAHNQAGALERVLGDRVRLEKVLSAPDLQLTRLEPLAPAPRAGAIIAASVANKAALLQATGLPAAPSGKTYEVWWITRESGPVAAGLFQASDGQLVVAPVSLPPAGEHVLLSAVTLELAGGVSKPAGAMYLKGTPGPV